MTILVDDRTGSKHLYAPLSKLCRHVELTTLQSGDCSWLGNGPSGLVSIGVELKRIHDLVRSMDDGRLSGTQLVAMANHFDYGYLIVEGLYRPDNKGTLMIWQSGTWKPLSHGRRQYVVKQINKFLNTLRVKCGVMTNRSGSTIETAGMIADWYAWWQEPWDSHKSYMNKTQQPTTLKLDGSRQSRLSRMLQELDGVGLDRAEAIAAVYGSMKGLIATATAKDIAVIPYSQRKDGVTLRIGPKTAQGIIKQLTTEDGK